MLFAFSVIFLGFFYSLLYSESRFPAHLNTLLFRARFPLEYVAYAALFAVLVLCIIRFVVNGPIPRVIIRFQLLAIVLLYLSAIIRDFFAYHAWGSFWSWDPVETWGLIILYVVVGATAYMIRVTPKKGKLLLVVGIQALVAVFTGFAIHVLLEGRILHSLQG